MKKLLFICTLGLASMSLHAQEAEATGQPQAVEEQVPEHLSFQNVSISGDILDFTERMQPIYRLKKKVQGDLYYIFEGPLFGYNVYVQASYTRKTKTVYKCTIMPKAINQDAWVDSLTNKFGEPAEIQQGLLWQRPEGTVLLYLRQGYDPALIYLDAKGNEAFKEEK